MDQNQLQMNLLKNAQRCNNEGKALAAFADVVHQLNPEAAKAVFEASTKLLAAYELQMRKK